MIDQISLKNFKGIKELNNLNLKPVTILCGTNRSGKSSLLQSILLMRQTLENPNPNQTLLLNGRFVRLGTFKDVIFQHDEKEIVSFKFSFNFSPEDLDELSSLKGAINRSRSLSNILRELLSNRAFRRRDITHQIDYAVSLKITNKVIVDSLNFHAKTIVDTSYKEFPGMSLEMNLQDDKETYDVSYKFMEDSRETEKNQHEGHLSVAKVEFMTIFPSFIAENPTEAKHIEYVSSNIHNFLREIFNTYTYIGPVREGPSRRYIHEEEILEIGNKGENAASLYRSEQEVTLDNHYFYKRYNMNQAPLFETKKEGIRLNDEEYFEKKEKLTLSETLEKWFDIMNIEGFRQESNKELVYLKMHSGLSGEETSVNMADDGFGVNQLFPILLKGLRMRKKDTLILEQPENHLHPKLQMQIADYFIALALSGKKVIAETHSDHIVYRLVRRIVEDENNALKELIKIYFITPSKNGTVFEEVNIDENQGITNWPVDFFDQAATELEKIMRAGLKKRKKLREQQKGHE